MKILYCGDVVGRSGREAVERHIPKLRKHLSLDVVIINGENSAGGFGITPTVCNEFYSAGVDVITTGNHVWAQKQLLNTIEKDPKLIRPLNYPPGTPGKGVAVHKLPDGRNVVVMQVLGRLFMESLDDPFAAIEAELQKVALKSAKVAAIVIDVHAEATSEKMSLAHMVDGRASLVVGTHTHIPTADHQILPQGTAFQCDAGMCGDYNSVTGMDKEVPIQRFTRKMPTARLKPASGEGTLCGVYVDVDDQTGLARAIHPVRVGGRLSQTVPE